MVADDEASGLLGELEYHRQLLDIGGRKGEAGEQAGLSEANGKPKTGEGLTDKHVFVGGCLATEASAARGARTDRLAAPGGQ